MALKVNFELDGIVYNDSYVRIHRVLSTFNEYEYFEEINDPDRPNVGEELRWKTRLETSATVYVWDDQEARENRAQKLHWFNFDFDYDLDGQNIYIQAYNALKTAKQFESAVDV